MKSLRTWFRSGPRRNGNDASVTPNAKRAATATAAADPPKTDEARNTKPRAVAADPRIATAEREAAGLIRRTFESEVQKLNGMLFSNNLMLGHARALQSAFQSVLPEVAHMLIDTTLSGEERRHRTKYGTIVLHVSTISCAMESRISYFSQGGGYGMLIDRLRGDPDAPLDSTAQIFAHVTVIMDTSSGQSLIHTCMLPNGSSDRGRCPVSVWPTELLNSNERRALGL